jgi:para-nitrobenzyl esterase
MRKVLLGSFLFGLLALTACSKRPVESPAPTAAGETLRATTGGALMGFLDADDTYAWLGIPYAKAPVGALRWRAPRAGATWDGVRQAVKFGNFCPQIGGMGIDIPKDQYGKVVGAEDCLFLNIWAPRSVAKIAANPDAKPLPVMVWIHGGGNTIGSADTYRFAHALAGRQQVVVVTINYRLGIFGWLRHPALAAATTEADPQLAAGDRSGNFGTLDIIQSLRWVRDNIAAFGGDPHNVTIFGESAGGTNVYSMLQSPLSQGLFHKAISQSGGIRTTSVESAENFIDEVPAGQRRSGKEVALALLQKQGVATTREAAKTWLTTHDAAVVAAWLRALTSEQLFAVLDGRADRLGLLDLPLVARDGDVISTPSAPELLADATPLQRVPLITGTNRDEMKTFQQGDPHFTSKWFGVLPHIRDRDEYERMARYGSAIWRLIGADMPATALTAVAPEPPVFVYRFDFDQLKDSWLLSLSELLGAGHGFEITYAFGLETNPIGKFELNRDDTLEARRSIASAMSSYWANFAYTGAPGKGRNGDLPEWQAWSNAPGGPKAMLIDAPNRGGVRQGNEALTVAQLKQELRGDPALKDDQATLCQTYARLFYWGLFETGMFDPQEYATLGQGGCGAYPVAAAAPR